jgi:urease beta subunit
MNAVKRTVKVLALCCVCPMLSATDQTKEPAVNEDAAVRIEITKLDVNDSTLALSYNIRNETDREAWVCSKVGRISFEVFLATDRQTLLIRKRLDVPSNRVWRIEPVGKYVRIAPGGSLAESLQIPVPVSPSVLYTTASTPESAQPVRRMALEIGYYDEDLPALVHSIFAVADKSGLTTRDIPSSILDTYFRGVRVRGALWSFDQVNPDPYGQGFVYIDYSWQALTGEKVLRVDVNDVSIAYEGYGERGLGDHISN